MSKIQAMQQNLLGSMEIALFMKAGIKRFNKNPADLKKSFLIPVLLLPLTIFTVLATHPEQNLDMTSIQLLTLIYSARLFVYLGAFLAFSYLIAQTMDRLEEFKTFVTANNWLTIPIAALTLIPLGLYLNGAAPYENIYPLIVMITLYSFTCVAFMATYIMRIPYEMAGFIAITGLLIHHNALDFLKWAAINTISFLA